MPAYGLTGYEQALQGGLAGGLASLNRGNQQGFQSLQRGIDAARAAYAAGASALTNQTNMGLDSLNEHIGEMRDAYATGRGDIQQGITGFTQRADQAISTLDPYAAPGGQAINLQAALTGAMGTQAQQQAYDNFMSSPGQSYLVEQAERALTRNAAATGGLGGGNVKKELMRNAIGMAAQDFGNQYDRLSGLSQQAQAAATNQGNFGMAAGQGEMQGGLALGNLQQNLGQSEFNAGSKILDARQALGGQLANLYANQAGSSLNAGNIALNAHQNNGRAAADAYLGTGNNIASGRFRVGEQMAGAIGDTSSALSNLRAQEGMGLEEIIRSGSGDLARLLTGNGQTQAQSLQGLASLLANIASGQGNQTAGLPGIPGIQQTQGAIGGIGSLLAGAGGAMAGWGSMG